MSQLLPRTYLAVTVACYIVSGKHALSVAYSTLRQMRNRFNLLGSFMALARCRDAHKHVTASVGLFEDLIPKIAPSLADFAVYWGTRVPRLTLPVLLSAGRSIWRQHGHWKDRETRWEPVHACPRAQVLVLVVNDWVKAEDRDALQGLDIYGTSNGAALLLTNVHAPPRSSTR